MKSEKIKMDKQKEKIEKYVLYTTCKLQLKDKKGIQDIMLPYIKSINDIYDFSDINNLILNNPNIELKYYKLWIPSTNIMLDTIGKIFYKKQYEINKIKQKEKDKLAVKYVSTKHLLIAIKILDKENIVIISGLPGVGKTTLANAISIVYENRDYEFVNIEKIDDYFNFQMRQDKKYIFFFDDFLGTIDYEITNEKEAKQIISVIKKINCDNKSTKLVITTREFVLNEGKQKSEALDNFDDNIAKLTINMKEYTNQEKLNILIKHIEYYQIQKNQVLKFIDNNKLLSVIKHQNYFPRIIDQSFEFYKDENNNLVDEILTNLNDSSRIWKLIFENKLIVIDIKVLCYLYFSAFILNHSDLVNQLSLLQFDKDEIANSLKRLEKPLNLLKLSKHKDKGLIINFFDPSIKDYLKRYIKENITISSFIVNDNVSVNNLTNYARLYMSEQKILEEYLDIYNNLVKCFLAKLEQFLIEERETKLKFLGMTISLMPSGIASLYEFLKINDEKILQLIFKKIKLSNTENTNCIKILCDISFKINNKDLNIYINQKLDRFIEQATEYDYLYFYEWVSYFEKHNKIDVVKKRIFDIETEIDYEEVDNDEIERTIDIHNEAIEYLEKFKDIYNDDLIDTFISHRELMIEELQNNYEEKYYSNEGINDIEKFSNSNFFETNSDNELINYFIEYFDLDKKE